MKQLQIRIYPDGRVEAETVGIKGEKCKEYIKTFEQLLDARTVESAYTDEYYEAEVHDSINQGVKQQNEDRHVNARIINKK